MSAKTYKYRVTFRKLSAKGDIQQILSAFETNSHFNKVLVHEGHLIGINFTFAKVFLQKISESNSKWIELDISDKGISEKVRKHLEEDSPQESTGGSPVKEGEDWSNID